MNSKYSKILQLSAEVIRKDVIVGHLKWKVTDLARSTRTARSVIYENLGKNKKEMLLNALKLLLEELYGLSPERVLLHKQISRFEAFQRSRAVVVNTPELLSFYFRNRDCADEVGEMIRAYEKRYLAAISKQTGVKNPGYLLFIRTVIHGISVAPFLDPDEVRDCMEKLTEVVKANR